MSRYRLPAEWEPHRATWLAWPHEASDWPGKLDAVRWCYADLIRHLADAEPVEIIVPTRDVERRARSRLARAGASANRLGWHRWATDRSWLRDSGGTFVVDATTGSPALVDWRFTAWARYPNWQRDNRLPTRIAAARGIPRLPATRPDTGRPMVLEGGAIDVNGAGAVLTTEQCLLDPSVQPRNPGLGRDQIETAFADRLGITDVIWLGRGIVGDDTHGHVDDVARFVATDVVVAAVEPDPDDPNHRPLADNLERLTSARVRGRPLTIVPLPMPRPLWFAGQRLPASYLNFYVANGVVLVPTFNDPADRTALDRLAELFPDREIRGIHALDLVWGLGTLHCLTLQEPSAGEATRPAATGP